MTILKVNYQSPLFPECLQQVFDTYNISDYAVSVTYSDNLLSTSYGLYDPVAVRREGQLLLTRAGGLAHSVDCNALTAMHKRYSTWCKKLQQLKCTQLVHGRFAPGRGITLYTAAIAADAAAGGWDYAAYYQSVLVHEYAHALHFAHILARFDACSRDVTSTAYQNALRYWYGDRTQALQARTVKETLAEFTRYLWCCENGWQPLAQAVTQSLTGARAYYPSYPYAGVRPLCALYAADAQQALEQYAALQAASLQSWQQAYALLKQIT